MEVIDTAEHWEWDEKADEGQFSYTIAVATDKDGKVYFTKTQERLNHIVPHSAQRWTEIPAQHIYPEWLSTLTTYESPSPVPIHIKRPRLVTYDGSQFLAESLLREATIYQTLGKHGSPFIAQYHGCVVSDGRITGLALTHYEYTLDARVKLGYSIAEATKWLDQIRLGVAFIHHHGLAHNDLNPSNIMISNENAVIIDFDSCCPIGETLLKNGTPGWADEKAAVSDPANDMFGLSKLASILDIPDD